MIAPTDSEQMVLLRLRTETQMGRCSSPHYTDHGNIDIYEDYLDRAQKAQPDDWIKWAGPNCGPMFKGVELLPLKKTVL